MKDSAPTPDLREQVAQILRDNITFSGQLGDFVIHGAIDKIVELFSGIPSSDGAEGKQPEAQVNLNPGMTYPQQVDYWMDRYFVLQEDFEKYRRFKPLTKEQKARFLHFLETNFITAPDNIYKTFDDYFSVESQSSTVAEETIKFERKSRR